MNDDAAIRSFLKLVADFHDGCLREVYIVSDTFVDESLVMHNVDGREMTAHLLIQLQTPRSPAAVELRFEQVIGFHVASVPADHDSSIFSATLFREDDAYYWAEASGWTPNERAPNEWQTGPSNLITGPITWIGGRRVSWRAADLGSARRYGPKAAG